MTVRRRPVRRSVLRAGAASLDVAERWELRLYAAVALPTLARKLPPPVERISGDLSNEQRTIAGVELVAEA
jgi:hypothetical protein